MICCICKKEVDNNYLIDMTFGKPLFICPNCYNVLDTCVACQLNNDCEFENSTQCQEPLYVMKTMRQGPMTVQQQVKNPERVHQTCELTCKCYNHEEKYCSREEGYCSYYKEIPILPVQERESSKNGPNNNDI